MAVFVPAALKFALSAFAAQQAAANLQDAVVQPFDDRASFLAVGDPQSLPARVDQAVGRNTCRRWARGELSPNPVRDANLRATCAPYLELIGENPGGVVNEPPFTGGQCPISYRVDFTRTLGETTASSFIQVTGPILGAITGFGPPVGTGSWQGIRVQGNRTGASFVQLGDGTTVRLLGANSGLVEPNQVSITGVSPISGADDCGDPPTEYEGPDRCCAEDPVVPPVFVEDEDYQFDVQVDFDPDGSVCVTITDEQGSSTSCFRPEDLVEDGEGQPGVSGGEPRGDGVSLGEPIPGSGENGAIGEDGGEDLDFGEPPAGFEWVGCRIQLDPASVNDGLIFGSAPGNAVFPRVVGNISLIYSDGRSEADRLTSEWAEKFRPNPNLQVTGSRVNLLPDVRFTVVPVAVESCPENGPCGGSDE